MKIPFGKPGFSRFVFVALLLLFNWPLLSIPAPENLFGWLFAAWGLAIALLCLVAHRAINGPDGEDGPEGDDGPDGEDGPEGEQGPAEAPKPEQAGARPEAGGGDV